MWASSPQDQECWELQGIPGLAGRECDSLRATGAAPAQDILGMSPEDGGGQGKAGTRVGGSGEGRAVGSCSPALWGVAETGIGGLGRLPWGPGPWTGWEHPWRTGKGWAGLVVPPWAWQIERNCVEDFYNKEGPDF